MRSFVHAIRHQFHGTPHGESPVVRQSDNRRWSMLGRSTSSRPERQDNIDRAFFESAITTIRLNERNLVLLEQEKEQLTKDNIALTGQITDLTMALEQKWLQRGGWAAEAVSALFQRFQDFHQDLNTKYTEALRIWEIRKVCVKSNGKDPDDAALAKQLGKNYANTLDVSNHVKAWYPAYPLYHMDQFFASIEKLHKVFENTFRETVKARVAETREKMVPLQPAQHTTSSTEIALIQTMSAVDSAFYTVATEQTDAHTALKHSNHQLRAENAFLENKVKDIRDMDAVLANDLRSLLYTDFSPSKFRCAASVMIEWQCKRRAENYHQGLQEINSGRKPFPGATASFYKTGLELLEQISSTFKELDQLALKIEHEFPEIEPTT